MFTKYIKKAAFVFCSVFFTTAVFAQKDLSNENILFIKGNIHDKTESVLSASQKGDYLLCLKGLDFALENANVLDTDSDILDLLDACLKNIRRTQGVTDSEISSKLCSVFKTFGDSQIKTDVLSRFLDFPSAQAVSIVNSFLSEAIQKTDAADDAVINSMKFLKANGNTTSFRLLFVADIINVWPDQKELLEESWGPLANNAETEILQLFSQATTEDKLTILNSVRKNPYVSKNIRGEVAENALSQAIYSVDDSSRNIIELQLRALEAVADCQWTRASSLATSYFSIAKNEYESGYISAQEFDFVISNVVKVAASKTGEILAQYLDLLNKSQERKASPEKVVVLSVINALGGLGDKAAFDSLLYVTYLDYPEDVISAARNALAKLKW